MTRKEATNFMDRNSNNETTVKTGYCCYQEDGISKFDMVFIGSNSGVYGWNWSLYYYARLNRYYLTYYRNTPKIPAKLQTIETF